MSAHRVVVVGGGFAGIDPGEARVAIVEAGDRLLPAFPPSLAAKAARALERIMQWAFSFVTRGREARLITEQPA